MSPFKLLKKCFTPMFLVETHSGNVYYFFLVNTKSFTWNQKILVLTYLKSSSTWQTKGISSSFPDLYITKLHNGKSRLIINSSAHP